LRYLVGEGELQVGGEEGVVHRHQRAAVVGEPGDRGDVADVHDRIGRGLQVNQLRLGAQRRLDLREIGGVHPGEGEAVGLQEPGEEAVGAAIDVARDHRVVAALEQGHQTCDG
jgi:hypothetical protein